MGNTSSLPERVYKAVKTGSVAEVQQLCQQLQRSNLDVAARRHLLRWTDAEGRTALTLAAQRNYLQIAKMLLEAGADVHYCARQRPTGGSALHEAVHGKHEGMVELLLSYRADPWLENGAGHTALDLAVANGHVALVRRLEKCALFSGTVSMKVQQLGGFSSAQKDRWCIILPRYMLPAPGQTISTVRVQLWVFKDATFAEPRTRVWLDGATAFRIGPDGMDGIVHLHPNHEQPKNAYTKYNKGWLLFFRPAVSMPAATAKQAFIAFINTCNRPFDAVAQGLAVPASSSGASSGASTPRPSYGGSASAAAAAAAATERLNQQLPPNYQPPPRPLHAGHPSLHARPATAPPPGVTASPARPEPWDPEVAAPGESDEDFARRLSGHASGPSGASLFGGQSTAAPRPPVTHSAHSSISSMTGSLVSVPSGEAAQPPSAPPAPLFPDNPFTGGSPARPTSAIPAGGLYPAVPSPAVPSPAVWSAAGTPAAVPSSSTAAAAAPVSATLAAALQRMPSEEAGLHPPALQDGQSDSDACVICLCAGREVGFLHGDSVHKCVCKECAQLVRTGNPCPMCRAPIERIMAVY